MENNPKTKLEKPGHFDWTQNDTAFVGAIVSLGLLAASIVGILLASWGMLTWK